jgi:hypothetical protein
MCVGYLDLSAMNVGEGMPETNIVGNIFINKTDEVTKDWKICVIRGFPVCTLHLLL